MFVLFLVTSLLCVFCIIFLRWIIDISGAREMKSEILDFTTNGESNYYERALENLVSWRKYILKNRIVVNEFPYREGCADCSWR